MILADSAESTSSNSKSPQKGIVRSTVRPIFKHLSTFEDKILIFPQSFALFYSERGFKFESWLQNQIYSCKDVEYRNNDSVITLNLEPRVSPKCFDLQGYQDYLDELILEQQQLIKYLYKYSLIPLTHRNHMLNKAHSLVHDEKIFNTVVKYVKLTQQMENSGIIKDGQFIPEVLKRIQRYEPHNKHKINQLIKDHPCAIFNYKPKGSTLMMDNFQINKKSLHLQGWTRDKFVTHVFDKGFPNTVSLFPNVEEFQREYENAFNMINSSNGINKNYKRYNQSASMTVNKKQQIGFQYKMYILPNMQDEEPQISIIVAVQSTNKDQIRDISSITDEQIDNFTKSRQKNLEQRIQFAQKFYNFDPNIQKDNYEDKTCNIRFINPEEQFVV